jgi:hypothetical protein
MLCESAHLLEREHEAREAEALPGDHGRANPGHDRGDPRTHQQVIAMTIEPLPLSPSAGGIAWEPIT